MTLNKVDNKRKIKHKVERKKTKNTNSYKKKLKPQKTDF